MKGHKLHPRGQPVYLRQVPMKKVTIFSEHYELFYEFTTELKRYLASEEAHWVSTELRKKQRELFDFQEPFGSLPVDSDIIITTHQEGELLFPDARLPKLEAGESQGEGVFSSGELAEFSFGKWKVLTLPDRYDEKDIALVLKRTLSLAQGKERYRSLIIGIDPGESPGLAVYGDSVLLYSCKLRLPEDCSGVITKVLKLFPSKGSLIRIGNGDRVIRNRIINSLLKLVVPLEIVDETSTTLQRKDSDINAAKRIAFLGGGDLVTTEMEVNPSTGYLEYIKKKSRKLSLGQFSLNQEQAEQVAQGQLTLEEAVARKKNGKKGEQNKNEKD